MTMTLSTLFYALGYLTGLAAFALMARARRMWTAGILTVMQGGLVGGLAAANAAQWVFGGTPGKTVLGGVAGGYITVVLLKRAMGLRRPTGDLFAVALSAGEAVGRWGCFFGGCCYGKPAHGAAAHWAVWQHGAWRHPTQAYLSFASLSILLALLWFLRRRPPENAVFFLQGALYCAARFVIEFYRASPPLAAGLTTAQWACIGGEVFFAAGLWLLLRRAHKPAMADADALYARA